MPTPSTLSEAASSAMPQTSSTPQATAGSSAQMLLEAISKLSGGGFQGPLTTSQTAMPTPQMPQVPFPINTPQVAQGPFGSTGERKRADRQALLSNIATFAQSAVNYHHEKKVREAAALYEQVMQAKTGMDQAAARGEEGKADYAHNKQILDDIFNDPKKAKLLEKGFNVKLLGDDKGKATPEHQGLQRAASRADKFFQQMPVVQGVNPQLQAQMALIKGGVLPKAGEQLTQQTELLKAIQTSIDKGFDRQSKEAIADKLVNVKDIASMRQYAGVLAQVGGRKYAADVVASSMIKRANIAANAQVASAEWGAAGKVASEVLKSTTADKTSKALASEITRLQDKVKDNNKILKDIASDPSNVNAQRATQIQQENELYNQNIKRLLNQMNQSTTGEPLEPVPGAPVSTESEPDEKGMFDYIFRDSE